MGQPTRIVERLHLRAGSESAVRRALPRLEDAFRTATLPDAGARLIIVRRLDLGRLPGGASPQSLSLLLESRFTQADWTLVHAGDAQADGGQAVWFRDPLDAHELAALRVAAGRSVDAWFWPLAVPALAYAASSADKLRAIAFSLAAQDEAPAALPVWAASLVRAGHGGQLIAALRPGDGTALLRAAGVAHSPSGRRLDAASTARSRRADADGPDTHPAPSVAVPPRAPTNVALDDRVEFVEQMSRRAAWRPAGPPSSPAFDRISAGPIDGPRETRREPSPRAEAHQAAGDSTVPARVADAAASIDVTGANRALRDSVAIDGRTRTPPARDRYAEPMPEAGEAERSNARDARADTARTDDLPSRWALSGIAPTAAGGLLFLVPALERLGFSQWCATVEAAGLPAPDALTRQMFHLLLSRLRIAQDDPAWQLAMPADDMSGASVDNASRTRIASRIGGLAPAEAWHRARSPEPGGRIPRDATIPGIWLGACRRLLRRRARIGLATLVVRPARMAITDTHVDVFFALHTADLRVRRAGLDIDPGWVPWFRRVVMFRYGR